MEALVQLLKITDDRQATLDSFAGLAGIDSALIDDTPFVLVGTVEHIADQIVAHRERWGFTSFVARVSDLADLCTLAEHLN